MADAQSALPETQIVIGHSWRPINSEASGSSTASQEERQQQRDREAEEDEEENAESGSDGSSESTPFSFVALPRQKKLLLVCLCLGDLFSNIILSILAPFFPSEAHAKGVSDTVSGWIFGVLPLAQFLFSPVVGLLIPVAGVKFLFLSGAFLSGGATVLFGLLDNMPSEDGGLMFIIFCIVTRIVTAWGFASFVTSSFVIIADEFDENVTQVFGITETFVGLGAVVGPAVGGFLYQWGGFRLPFFVLGGLYLLTVPLCWPFIPAEGAVRDSNISSCVLLRLPGLLLMTLTIMVLGSAWSMFEPVLEPELRQYQLAPEIIGLVFLAAALTYAVCAPLIGCLSDRLSDSTPLVLLGMAGCSVAMAALGPSPLFLDSSFRSLLLLLLLGAGVRCNSKDGHFHDTDGDGVDEHDAGFDQDRFLGKERAKEFSGLGEQASVQRLKKLITDEVDLNKDGFVTEDELVKHLDKINQRQLVKDLDKNWQELNASDNLDWETYAKSLQPGIFEDEDKKVKQLADKALEESKSDPAKISVEIPAEFSPEEKSPLREFFSDLVKHRRRWRTADTNADGVISKEEYWHLLFPDESPLMQELMATEMLENLDTDGDGRVSKEEMMADLWKPKAGEKEPEWLEEERKEFDTKKDANGDGFLDKDEIRRWVQDPASGSSSSEAAHLLREADKDKDGRLSIDEIAASHDLFAGSQATNYGEDVEDGGGHDEL